MTRTQPLRIGIAGLGRLGWRHAENIVHRVQDAHLTWACSPVPSERQAASQRLGVRQLTHDFTQLVNAHDVDAVVLVTPTALHAEQTIAALEAGKHVFVEKPLALNLADCERVEAVAARHPDRIAMVGFVRRFDLSYRHAYDALQRGALGRPFLVRSQTCDLDDPSGFFVQYAAQSGGIFMDCSIHDIDLARWMLGNPRALRVFATGVRAVHEGLATHDDVDNGLAIVEFDGGALGAFYASRTFAHGHETQTEIVGTHGKLVVGHDAARDRVVFSDGQGVRHEACTDFFERFGDAFVREMNAFVAACRGGPPSGLQLSDATEATRIGLAIRRAMRSGQAEFV